MRELQAALPPGIQSQRDGPYLVTNVERLTDWLGDALPTRPQMALCRCGRSATKPFCDGTHAEIGFDSAKDPARVPDRRETHVGQQLTILDNRGICHRVLQRSPGDGLSRGPRALRRQRRMDELIRAVRDCPRVRSATSTATRPAQVDHGTRAGHRGHKDGLIA